MMENITWLQLYMMNGQFELRIFADRKGNSTGFKNISFSKYWGVRDLEKLIGIKMTN